jgi:hypothetical protein
MILLSLAKTFDHILSGLDFAFLDLTDSERQDLQESHCFQGLLVAFNVLYDNFGFAVLSDDQGFPMFVHRPYDFGGMGLQVTDGLDLTGQFHWNTSTFE